MPGTQSSTDPIQPAGPSLTRDRIDALRSAMGEAHCDAVILPTGDPHISEYPCAHWCSRAWLSGFDGSAGTLVVTGDTAWLWTDGRYYTQATQQLADTGIGLMKAAEPDAPSVEKWLGDNLKTGSLVHCDGQELPANTAAKIGKSLAENGIKFELHSDLVVGIWQDRPALPGAPGFVLNNRFSGKTVLQKLKQVRSAMTGHKATHYLVSSLDAAAWLLNVRGGDIPWTPFALAHVVVGIDSVDCFIGREACTPVVKAHLSAAGVGVRDYDDLTRHLKTLDSEAVLLLDPALTCATLRQTASETCKIVESADPVQKLKAVKNSIELDNLRQSTRRDCAALARFLCWVDRCLAEGTDISELSAAAHLETLRSEGDLFIGPSFESIAGYAAHGALMHYAATPASDTKIKPEGFFLIDSGGQYFDGTTDITRTIACGHLSDRQRRDYTLVLKSHIALCLAVFPYGTTGAHLDILARGVMAREGLNYRCGTGHGIGFCGNVHEGPQGVANGQNAVKLEPGMLLTNEPGIYREDEYGIRIENTLVVRENEPTEFGRFLSFELLSYCPIDPRPVVWEMLTDDETNWFKSYQSESCSHLTGLVDTETRSWLQHLESTKNPAASTTDNPAPSISNPS